MSPETIGTLGLIALLLILAAGVPIAVAMGVVGAVGLSVMLSPEAALIKAGVHSFEVVSSYELGVLPLFVLMAHLCFAVGATQKFFDVAAKFVGHRPGGLALASIGGCAVKWRALWRLPRSPENTTRLPAASSTRYALPRMWPADS